MNYSIVYTKQAVKDITMLKSSGYDKRAKRLIDIIRINPFQNPPPYEKLVGDLSGLCSRRINVQHRLVYEIIEESKTIKIISLWKHYEL